MQKIVEKSFFSEDTKPIKMTRGRLGNVEPVMEWIKWLSYQPEFINIKLEEIYAKQVKDLTIEDLDLLKVTKENKRLAELYKIYGTNKITKEEAMEVYNHMGDAKIEDLMLSKLTKEELEYAKGQIETLKDLPRKELTESLDSQKEPDTYISLSMVDSYILHILCSINLARSIAALNNNIAVKLKENEEMRIKSYIYARDKIVK